MNDSNVKINFDEWDNNSIELNDDHLSKNELNISHNLDIYKQLIYNIELDITTRSSEWFKLITFIKYKYHRYNFWNTVSSLTIIFLSSTITFLEALRANLDLKNSKNDLLNFYFTIVTLTLGFLIAVITSIVKFFNLQGSLENFKIVSLSLEKSYADINILLHYIRISIVTAQLKADTLFNLIEEVKNRYVKILNESVKYENEIHNNLNPENITHYLKKFYKNENINNSVIIAHRRHIKTLGIIEDKIGNLEKELLGINIETYDTNIKSTISDLKKYLDNVNQYKLFLDNVFNTHDFDQKCNLSCCNRNRKEISNSIDDDVNPA